MKTKFLANKSFEVDGEEFGRLTWYTPLEYLKECDGVIDAEHDETSSSAGDWKGHIIQKYRGSYWLMFFSQENHVYSFGVNIVEAIKLSSKNDNSAKKEAMNIIELEYSYSE